MFNTKEINFNALKRLSMRQRMDVAQSPSYSRILMSALTPTEIAELFPKYYLRQLPDVGGFMKAVPTSALREKQAGYDKAMGRPVEGGAGSSGAVAGGMLGKSQSEMQKKVYDAYVAAGFSRNQALALTAEVGRENAYNPKFIFGTHSDPANSATNLGMISMQGSRHAGLYSFMQSKGLIGNDGQIVQSQEALVAMAQYQKQEMETGAHGGSPKDIAKTKEFLNNPNIDPEEASAILGRNYIRWRYDDPAYSTHHAYRRNYLQQAISNTGGPDTDKSGTGTLAKSATAYQGADITPSGAEARSSAELMQRATEIGQQGRHGFTMKGAGSGGSALCGVGARSMAGALFNSNYFAKGMGGNAHSLSEGNQFFQNSGLYNQAHAPQGDVNDPAYLDSLPVGTVISAAGGGRGQGHVQIKMGNGQWVSDFEQGNRVLKGSHGVAYSNYQVHTPNERGIDALARRGINTSASSSPDTFQAANATPAPQVEAAPTYPSGPGGAMAAIQPMLGGMGPMGGMIGNMMGGMGGPMAMMGPMMGGGMLGSGMLGGMIPLGLNLLSNLAEGLGDGTGGHREDLGAVSAKYESGKRGVETISTGRRDPGGVSYGRHQLSSRKGTMKEFLNSEYGQPYKDRFGSHAPGTTGFNKAYKQIASEDPTAFARAQHSFITKTLYEPTYAKAAKMGYKVDDPRVQEALFSMSVQHGRGGASRLLNRAKVSVGGDAVKQVDSLFHARETRFKRFANRYDSERKDILAMDLTPKNTMMADVNTSKYPMGQNVKTASVFKPSETPSDSIVSQKTRSAPTPSPYVEPKTKVAGLEPPNSPVANQYGQDHAKQIAEMQSSIDTMQAKMDKTPPGSKTTMADVDPNFINNLANKTRTAFSNPSVERAIERASFKESGNHYSYGNTDLASR